ncbi:Selenocysteine-specific elongation factor [compost metagenome]
MAREANTDEATVRLLLRKLARLGLLHQVVKDLFYPESTIRHLAAHALQLRDEEGIIQAASFRDRLGIGRKRCIQLLEYFDRIGFTRRIGNERRIREDSALAQPPG